ncbi:fructose-2,6-bisphosphatase TIGAR B isoform X2 [Synchiropus splendidus]|uniref:fructose-2,6-bisphosphatase TIGAR B isoform X2 n=1 Tax=Synchiropus splendidus TaxID=270530 RepID=UPI00237D7284|nr:fructose-2,6-bisphosphatase TIGAR B isoform X2 [Synchiropus splendidus]
MLTFSLTLVRHGETQYNKDKLLQGQGVDTTLSEVGVQQGEAVGQYLSGLHFHHVYVSNLQRTVQTAELILRNNSLCSGAEMVLEPLLRERSFGVAEGRPKEDLKNMANACGQSVRQYTPPGGETLEQVLVRFKKFLRSLFRQLLDAHSQEASDTRGAPLSAGEEEEEGGAAAGLPDDGLQGVPVHVLLVSHGAYIRVAVRHLIEDLKCSLPSGAKMSQLLSPSPNTGISRFVLSVSQAESTPALDAARCVFVNRKGHLDRL